ncbi:MAG: VOC family protein [Cyanobacteria bacterium P01_A01_bin.3]
MALPGLGHVAIQVADISKALEFYRTLGMTVVWEDSDWAYVKAGEDGLALLGPGYKAAGPHFGFVFRDRDHLEAEHQRIAQLGVKLGAIHDHRDGTASCYGKDLDGNVFELLYEPDESAS